MSISVEHGDNGYFGVSSSSRGSSGWAWLGHIHAHMQDDAHFVVKFHMNVNICEET